MVFIFGAYLTLFPFVLYESAVDLKNINYDNYPLYTDSKIISESYTINSGFALHDHLLLYYLDVPNSSFIVHPSDFRRHYSSDLVFLDKIQSNEILYQIESKPDIVICPINQQFKIGKFQTSCNTFFVNNSEYYKFNSISKTSNIYLKISSEN